MQNVDFEELKQNAESLPWDSDRETLSQSLVKWLREEVEYYNWVGIYWVEKGELVLGPWDGPEATEHVRIPADKGICGLSAQDGNSIIVPDVRVDPRYIACFLNTKAEIVVPVMRGDETIGVIDVDSDTFAAFRDGDQKFLEWLGQRIGNLD